MSIVIEKMDEFDLMKFDLGNLIHERKKFNNYCKTIDRAIQYKLTENFPVGTVFKSDEIWFEDFCLKCDGSLLSKDIYKDLYSAIGSTLIGDNYFKLPLAHGFWIVAFKSDAIKILNNTTKEGKK